MAVRERGVGETEQVAYAAPETERMPRIPKEAAALVCELGYRVAFVEGDQVKVEPLQEGVHRYPPVHVGVERDPEAVDRYINLSPTIWSEVL